MKLKWTVFCIAAASLLITLNQFWNLGIYVDEHGTSPAVVLGGELQLYLSWVKLLLLGLLCLILFVDAVAKLRKA